MPKQKISSTVEFLLATLIMARKTNYLNGNCRLENSKALIKRSLFFYKELRNARAQVMNLLLLIFAKESIFFWEMANHP